MRFYNIFFSPTGGTEKVADIVAKGTKLDAEEIDRETYECRSCRKNGTPYMEKAPVPYPPVLHSLASASTITWLIHQKFELSTALIMPIVSPL